jgi:phosphatidylglycerophosphate synthase
MNAVLLIVRRWENTTPNFISLARLLISLWGLNVFYWWYWNPWFILLLGAIGMGLDAVDGWVARTFGQTSFSGKLLDPLVDKVIAWNAAFTIAAWTAIQAGVPAASFLSLCVPPLAIIGVYDYMTMKMRATDEDMATSVIAKQKQVVLFISLGTLVLGMCFADAYAAQPAYPALYATHLLFIIVGTLLMWQALRLTVRSARTYLHQSSAPAARDWLNVGWVQFIFRIL